MFDCEVNPHAAYKRHEQGWLSEVHDDLDLAIDRLVEARDARVGVSIGYVGNIVDVWERLIERDVNIDLGRTNEPPQPIRWRILSRRTPYKEAMALMAEDPDAFRAEIQLTLVRTRRPSTPWPNVACISGITATPSCSRPRGRAQTSPMGKVVSDIRRMLRTSWVRCASISDLAPTAGCAHLVSMRLLVTDAIASKVIRNMLGDAPDEIRQQLLDNLRWIESANDHQMAVGTGPAFCMPMLSGALQSRRR